MSPTLSALLSVLLWSTVATAFKLTLKFLNPFELILLSSLFSLLILTFLNILKGNLYRIGNLKKVHLLLLSGLLVPSLYYILLFNAYNILYAHEALILNYTWPIWLSIFSVLLYREKISLTKIMGLLLGFTGVIIIATRKAGFIKPDPLGVFLALSSGIVWGIYWNILKKFAEKIEIKLFFSFLSGTSLLLLFNGFIGLLPESLPSSGLLGALYIGMFEMSLTFILWLNAIERANSTAFIANIAFLAPVLSVFWIWLILKEPLDLRVFIALFLVLSGVYISGSRS